MKLNKFKSFWNWFWLGLENQRDDKKLQVVAKQIRKFFQACPACQKSFKEHQFARIAITILTQENENRVADLLDVLREDNWKAVFTFDEFDVLEDAAVVQVIKCPTNKAVWLVSREPYSLDDPYQLIEYQTVMTDESLRLFNLITEDNWADLNQ